MLSDETLEKIALNLSRLNLSPVDHFRIVAGLAPALLRSVASAFASRWR
jgi:hypothetical protein